VALPANRRPAFHRLKEHTMKKLRIEDLVVDSFTTSKHAEQRGTVAGFDYTDEGTCGTACSGDCNETMAGCGTGTMHGVSCADLTCMLGATECGTCAPAYTCDAAEGTQCWGDSQDMRIC
jgi:hypothetical protein